MSQDEGCSVANLESWRHGLEVFQGIGKDVAVVKGQEGEVATLITRESPSVTRRLLNVPCMPLPVWQLT